MAETPPDPALRDPFFSTLRREHPDVTLVMLPPETTARPSAGSTAGPPPGPVLDLTSARDLQHRARHALAGATAAAWTLQDGPRQPVERWWRLGPGEHRFRTRRVLLDLPSPLRSLGAALDALQAQGWQLRARTEPRPGFSGELGDLRVEATAYPSSLQVQVTSAAVRLDPGVLVGLGGPTGRGGAA